MVMTLVIIVLVRATTRKKGITTNSTTVV